MNRIHGAITRSAFAVIALTTLAPNASAQLVSASAASLALGDNYTALARGFNAMNWNPAGLGMPDNPFFSFAFTGRGAGGTGPISLSDLSRYSGVAVPQAVLASWLTHTACGTATPLYLERSLSEIGPVPPAPRPVNAKEKKGLSGMPNPAGFQFIALKPRASAV